MMNFAQIPLLGRTGFHPFYNRVLNKAVSLGYTLPSGGQQRQQNTLVVSLVNIGFWNNTDIMYVPANDSGSNFSRINWIDPDNYLLSISGPTHTSNQGYVGDGGFIDTGWVPSINGVHYTQNNASVFAYEKGNTFQTNNTLFGWIGAALLGRTILDSRNTDSTVTWQINQTGVLAASGSVGTSEGFHHLDRSLSNLQEYYKDGSLLLSDNAGTSGIANVSAYLLATNDNGVSSVPGTNRILSFFSAGGSMAALAAAVDTIISNYIDNL